MTIHKGASAELYSNDALTGLLDRRSFMQRLVAEYEQAKKVQSPLSVIALDLDHFREINQSHLHIGGDKVLIEIARLVSSVARPGDIVGRDGGDQISLILPATDREKAHQEAERIRQAVESLQIGPVRPYSPEPISVTISVGVATAAFAEAEASELWGHARNAVHKAKASGRNCVAVA